MNPSSDTGAAELLANLSVSTVVLIALALTVLRFVLLSLKGKPTKPGGPPEVNSTAKSFAEIIESLIIAGVLVFLIIRPFFVQAFYIPSESMEPTLEGHDADTASMGKVFKDTVHDHIFVNKLVYRYSEPQFRDIIVFKAPASADMESMQKGLPQKENILIKRLMGLPGDTMWVHDSAVWRKRPGEKEFTKLVEPYILEKIDDPQPTNAIYAEMQPLTLGPNQLFVMGDNRNDSNDSRFWGPLDRGRVIGKASLIFYPFNRIRILKTQYP